MNPLRLLLGVLIAIASPLNSVLPHEAGPSAATLGYDIVYVRQPRRGDSEHIRWPEVFHPAHVEPGSDLMLLHPDGSEEVLIAAGNGGVTDPFVSFDAKWVYYSYFHDQRPAQLNYQRGDLPLAGADIYRIHLATRERQRLTHQEFTPNTGAGQWDEHNPVNPSEAFNRLGYGILNTGPTPIAGGRVMFTSNRNGFTPNKGHTNPTMQLFVMDEDGGNVTPIAPMTIGSALHPVQLKDGRVMFSSYEAQGLRDARMWGIWTIRPDGQNWEPLMSAFKWANALHFATQLGGGDIVVEDYYNLNNWGFGALYRFPANPPAGQPRFLPANPAQNPPISQTLVFAGNPQIYPRWMPFSPRGLHSITPLTNAEDEAAPFAGGQFRGKFTHPAAALNNDLLVVWSGGPVNALNRPVYQPAVDSGIYLQPGGNPVNAVSELVLIKNNPEFNEAWPRPVLSYKAIHGVDEPVNHAWLPNDGNSHAALPAGTAFGLVGSSSLYKRESAPGYAASNAFGGLDAFNSAQNEADANWFTQGADAGKYSNADIWAVRLLAMEPNTHRSYGPNLGQHFFNHINEKLRILGEIPVRKSDAAGNLVLDPEGNPDTSFLVKVPADTPFTFQTLDRNGMVLNMAQTWHQVRPGEMRANCGGCHAHSQQPLAFEQTAASRSGYPIANLGSTTPLLTRNPNNLPALRTVDTGVVNVEFYRDIRPVLQRSCAGCHVQGANPPGNLVLNDLSMYPGPAYTDMQFPGDYMRLCFDARARWGHQPLVGYGGEGWWRNNNASRYVRLFQSRRSLLIWKLFGARLDGWTNSDHPSESTPGVAATLPAGANINEADLDYTGSEMPPAGSGYPALSADEKMNIARWVDLGCPINTSTGSAGDLGWFVDDMRPALTVSAPRAGVNTAPLSMIRIGVADANSGILPGSLSITANIALAGRAAGAPLADLALTDGDGIYTIPLSTPLTQLSTAQLFASVQDNQTNITRVTVRFSVDASESTPTPPPPGGVTRIHLPVIAR